MTRQASARSWSVWCNCDQRFRLLLFASPVSADSGSLAGPASFQARAVLGLGSHSLTPESGSRCGSSAVFSVPCRKPGLCRGVLWAFDGEVCGHVTGYTLAEASDEAGRRLRSANRVGSRRARGM